MPHYQYVTISDNIILLRDQQTCVLSVKTIFTRRSVPVNVPWSDLLDWHFPQQCAREISNKQPFT